MIDPTMCTQFRIGTGPGDPARMCRLKAHVMNVPCDFSIAPPPFATQNPERAKTWVRVINAMLMHAVPTDGDELACREDFMRHYPVFAYWDSMGGGERRDRSVELRELRKQLVEHFDIPANGGTFK